MMLDKTVDVADLQAGMIPAEQIVEIKKSDGGVRYEKRLVAFSSGREDGVFISPDPAGLDAEAISQLQHLAAAGALAEFENRIKIQPAICFAPVVSVGALLTVLCQGPFYLKLMALF